MAGEVAGTEDGAEDVRAMFDASVLFKAAVFRFFVLAAQTGLYVARWTNRIVFEAESNLAAQGRDSALTTFRASLVMLLDPVAPPAPSGAEDSLPETDAKDRHVLAAAINDHCSHVVTDNDRDFNRAEAAGGGVEVIDPDRFGVLLLERNPAAVVRGIDRTPPERLDRYLGRLATEMPRTGQLLRSVFYPDDPPRLAL